ncbi:MAG: hypothetical protein H6933_01725 [Burkholderiaceae bacterium]|nr:hypothetical protein [Rhodoferax sp.]MCP5283599.1 hypothetical protein [Burkholderiaceae bacterium]
MRLRIACYLLTAWLLPPMLAGMAGWRGVWGTGSAAFDFLLPWPVSGGVLHLPSWGLGAGLLGLRQRAGSRAPWWGRMGAAAMAGSGAVLLLDMNALALALQTDAPWPSAARWFVANPLGLFMLCDGLLASLWPGVASTPMPRPLRIAGLALALLLPLVFAVGLWRQAPVARHDLLLVTSRPGPARGDERVAVYTRMPMQPALLGPAVAGRRLLPDLDEDVNVQDQAVLFFDSHDAAQRLDVAQARLTWCRYEDGTPEQWHTGAADCFGPHQNFSERLAAAHAGLDAGHSPPVRRFLALASTCRAQRNAPECHGLDRERATLQAQAGLSDLDRQALSHAD